jgi:hypothetical protein
MTNRKLKVSRRRFIKGAIKGAIASSIVVKGFPDIVPASVFGANAPGNRINVGAIGVMHFAWT